MSFQGKINAEWHTAHPMPEKPSREERVMWHHEQAKSCGCRPFPDSLAYDVRAMKRQAREVTRPG